MHAPTARQAITSYANPPKSKFQIPKTKFQKGKFQAQNSNDRITKKLHGVTQSITEFHGDNPNHLLTNFNYQSRDFFLRVSPCLLCGSPCNSFWNLKFGICDFRLRRGRDSNPRKRFRSLYSLSRRVPSTMLGHLSGNEHSTINIFIWLRVMGKG
jgi:hypothetical protein